MRRRASRDWKFRRGTSWASAIGIRRRKTFARLRFRALLPPCSTSGAGKFRPCRSFQSRAGVRKREMPRRRRVWRDLCARARRAAC